MKPLIIPAISLWAPWATFIEQSWKSLETRSWKPPEKYYREDGTFWCAIHQGKRVQPPVRELCAEGGLFNHLLRMSDFGSVDGVPLGAVLCVVRFAMPIPTEQLFQDVDFSKLDVMDMTRIERELGDYSPGRWAWPIKSVISLENPVPCKGSQGFFNWTAPEELTSVLTHEMGHTDGLPNLAG